MTKTRDQTIQFAERKGVLGTKKSYLTLKKSNICDGLGVFTNKFIKDKTYVTQYTGYKRREIIIKKMNKKKNNKYIFTLDDEKFRLIGTTNIKKLIGKGIGQFCNDTISKTLTCLENNCNFVEINSQVYIKAIRDILPGEELYVSYGIKYWLDEIMNYSFLYDEKYIGWAIIMKKIVDICDDYLSSNPVYEIIDFDESNDIISIYLENSYRKCPYLKNDNKDFHINDHTIQFKLIKNNNNCKMIYHCSLCAKCHYEIGNFNIND